MLTTKVVCYKIIENEACTSIIETALQIAQSHLSRESLLELPHA
jgi:hypothetical protein